jgi:hypothetical protein
MVLFFVSTKSQYTLLLGPNPSVSRVTSKPSSVPQLGLIVAFFCAYASK